MGGPSAAAVVVMADHHEMIVRCRSTGKAASSRPRLVGVISAPPTPSIARKAISASTDGANAHSTPPMAKIVMPSRNRRRRPNLSAILPAGTSSAANTIP